MIDQGNLINSPQQVVQNWIMTVLGLLKSGKVRLRRTIDQGNLIKLLGVWYNKFVLITETLLDGTAQSVRYGGLLRNRSAQLDKINFQEVADSANFVMGSDAAEFVNKVNDQVRKRQKRMSNVAGSGEEHPIIWRMFMAATMNAATFMGMNFQDNQNSIVNTTDLTLKQMFDISPKLVGEQDEIFNVDKIQWEKHSWKHLSLIGDETVISLQRTKVNVFSDSVVCLGKIHQNLESNEVWKKRIEWITCSQSYRDFDGREWRAD